MPLDDHLWLWGWVTAVGAKYGDCWCAKEKERKTKMIIVRMVLEDIY
jgi:hypothetical protein